MINITGSPLSLASFSPVYRVQARIYLNQRDRICPFSQDVFTMIETKQTLILSVSWLVKTTLAKICPRDGRLRVFIFSEGVVTELPEKDLRRCVLDRKTFHCIDGIVDYKSLAKIFL